MATQRLGLLISAKDNASRVMRNIRRNTGELQQKVGQLVKAYVGLRAAIGAMRFLAGSAKLFDQQAVAVAKLDQVLRSTGNAVGLTSRRIQIMASELQAMTRFADEAIIPAQQILLTFTSIGRDIFPEAIETVLNMSTAFGQDLKGSAIQLGKALEDPIKGVGALARVGVSFNEQQKEMIKTMVETGNKADAQRVILEALEVQVGGAAKAAGEAGLGGWVKLTNSFGDLREAIGKAMTQGELFNRWIRGATDLVQKFTRLLGMDEVHIETKAINAQLKTLNERLANSHANAKRFRDIIANAFQGEDVSRYEDLLAIVEQDIIEIQGEIDEWKKKQEGLVEPTKKTGDEVKKTKEQIKAAAELAAKAEAQRIETEQKAAAERQALINKARDNNTAVFQQEYEEWKALQEQRIVDGQSTLEQELAFLSTRLAAEELTAAQEVEIINRIRTLRDEAHQEQMAAIRAETELRLGQAGAVAGGLAALASINKKASRENFLVFKGFAIVESAIAGILASTKALAAGGGFPTGLPFMFKTAALATARTAAIASKSFQTDEGEFKVVPGPRNLPVPATVHGGEVIGRPGSFGNTVMVAGDVFGWDESMERIRQGLFDSTKMTGMPVQGA